MRFERPLLLLTLLVLAALVGLVWWLLRRRRMRYAVRFTNIEVLAAVAGAGNSLRRIVPAAIFVAALAALALASARPHVERMVAKERAMVILVVDTSRSMQAEDVEPTRLGAAQDAMRRFVERAPKRLRIGFIVFAGEAQVATPPTTDHDLVRESIDSLGEFQIFGGTAIGDALASAVELAQESLSDGRQTIALRAGPADEDTRGLASILFLSDGFQTRGNLLPAEGAARAKDAGIPVYTVALGTPEGVIQGRSFGFGPIDPGQGGPPPGFGDEQTIPVPPDPETLRQIAETTGGRFTEARTADVLTKTYEKLGSSLGREPGETEVTFAFLAAAGGLLLAAGVLSALWSPRFP